MPEPTVPYGNSVDEDRGSIAPIELPTVSMINDHTQDLLNSLHNISNLMDLLRNWTFKEGGMLYPLGYKELILF